MGEESHTPRDAVTKARVDANGVFIVVHGTGRCQVGLLPRAGQRQKKV